ncbi:MAG: DUF998 domain-containing protein [Chloroflexales bacterium]|nr:DUF998 domain-containing protein [Chloroflexales bacterium]
MPEQNETVMRRAIVGAHASGDTTTRVLAGGGVAGPILFSVITIVAAALRPDYSHITSFISELGASGTPHAPLMNYLGFVPAGLFLAAFGIALVRATSQHVLAVVGAVLVGLFGVGVAVSGIVSCDPGCPVPGGSLENAAHNVIGPLSFIALACGVGLLGAAFRRLPYFRPVSRYSLVTSILGLLFIVAIVGSLEAKTLTGLWQRLFLATLFLWCAVIGIRVARDHRSEA